MLTVLARGVKLCQPDTDILAEPEAPASVVEVPPAPPPPPAAGDKRSNFECKLEQDAKIAILHTRCPGRLVAGHHDCDVINTVHRYVVIDDLQLCAQLNRSPKEQIDDLIMEDGRWSETQMKARATVEAETFLRQLTARETPPSAPPALLPAAPPARRTRTRAVSSSAQPAAETPYAGEARGMFIRKGMDEHGVFVLVDGVRLDGNGSSEERQEILRYSDMSLLIAVAEQNVQRGQEIHIRPTGVREMNIIQQSSGACGQGQKICPMKVTLYEVHVLPEPRNVERMPERSRHRPRRYGPRDEPPPEDAERT